MDLTSRIRYVYHYDELSWMPDVLDRPFNLINIPYDKRRLFLNWLDKYTAGQVYIWSGSLTPALHQYNWGHIAAPDEETTFIIFDNEHDQTRFALEFVGNPVGMSATIFKNGTEAYHYRKR